MTEDPMRETAEEDVLEEYQRKVDMRLRERGYVQDRRENRVLKAGRDGFHSPIGTLETWIRPGRIVGQGILAFVGVTVVLGLGMSVLGREPNEVVGGIGGWTVLALWGYWIWRDRQVYKDFERAYREADQVVAKGEP